MGGVVGVASEESEVRKALETAVVGGFDLVVTVGGTGVGPRDITPEVTEEILDQRLPGIAEALLATAIGLVAAIPAVVIYNVFARASGGYRLRLTEAASGVERLVSRDLDRRAAGIAV